MNIVFNKVTIKNFMSFSYAELSLTNKGYVLVNGINNNPDDFATSNGSGKSTLWNAINWALTGETIHGSKDIVNIFLGEDAEVTLDFNADGDNYVIVRGKTFTNNSSSLSLYKNNENISGKGIRDTEQILKTYLPDLSSLLIGSVIILGQGLPHSFTNNSPSGRKEILEKLSKSDFMIEDLKERIKGRRQELDKQLRESEDSYLKSQTELTIYKNQLTSINNSLDKLEDDSVIQKKLDDATSYQKELTDYYSSLENYINGQEEKVDELKQELNDIKLEFEQEKSNINLKYKDDLNNKKQEQSGLNSQILLLNRQIKEFESVVDVCPTCGQKLVGVTKIDTTDLKLQVQGLNSQLNQIVSDIKLIEDNLNQELKLNSDKYSDNITDKETIISGIEKLITSNKQTYSSTGQELSKLITEITDYTNQLKDYNINKDNLLSQKGINEIKINELTNDLLVIHNNVDDIKSHININSKMNTVITRDFRGYLLQNIINFINKKAKEYCEDVFHTDKLNFALDGNNISISYCSKEYEVLSGGEKQKVSLIIQLAIRDMLCKFLNFSSNILVLDEIVDFLDKQGTEKIINLISDKLTDVTSIFFVTHHTDLMFPYDEEITIIKDEKGISSIC